MHGQLVRVTVRHLPMLSSVQQRECGLLLTTIGCNKEPRRLV
jgi:hypothetical protein